MDMLAQNIRFAFRTLRRNPLFAIFAIVTLGLGIGANTAIFSVINGVLLKPLPYASGDRLVLIRQSAPLAGRAERRRVDQGAVRLSRAGARRSMGWSSSTR